MTTAINKVFNLKRVSPAGTHLIVMKILIKSYSDAKNQQSSSYQALREMKLKLISYYIQIIFFIILNKTPCLFVSRMIDSLQPALLPASISLLLSPIIYDCDRSILKSLAA